MRFYATAFVFLYSLISGYSSNTATNRDSEFEPHASASAEQWQVIKSHIKEVDSLYGTPENFGVVLQHVHTKMCLAGYSTDSNMQLLMNMLKFKAFALGATGITKIGVNIVPWKNAPHIGPGCLKGYMEGTATALILNKERFPD
ncbi:hypothetical protein [Pseudomonas farris]